MLSFCYNSHHIMIIPILVHHAMDHGLIIYLFIFINLAHYTLVVITASCIIIICVHLHILFNVVIAPADILLFSRGSRIAIKLNKIYYILIPTNLYLAPPKDVLIFTISRSSETPLILCHQGDI